MTEGTTHTIELIYFDGCPHADAARQAVSEAVASMDAPVERSEWRQDDADTPDWAQRLPSPTVMVDGENVVGGVGETAGKACAGETPSAYAIRRALERAAG